MPKPTVCAIVPTYNRSALLRVTLDGILAQTRPVDQILVINDGSNDNTEEVVKSYGDRVTLITKKNGGKAAAQNTALEHCTADFVWICDDDDYADPKGIEILADMLDADPSLDVAMGNYTFFREVEGKRIFTDRIFGREGESNLKILFLDGMMTNLAAMLIRRSLFSATGPFRSDVGMVDDHDMAIRVLRNAKAVYVPKVIYYYRQHEGVRGNSVIPLMPCQRIFAWVRNEYRLDEYTPTFALTWDEKRRQRAALCERACVMARWGLWHEAIEDFKQVAQFDAGPMSAEEFHLIEAVPHWRNRFALLIENPAYVAEMRECSALNDTGFAIVQAFLCPTIWGARQAFLQGDFREGFRKMRQLFIVGGFRGASARIISSIKK